MRALLVLLLGSLALSGVACSADEQAAAPPPATVTVTVSEPTPPPAAEDESLQEDDPILTADAGDVGEERRVLVR